ncbi:unnamed protein product [Jaminaea pallidilutea]
MASSSRAPEDGQQDLQARRLMTKLESCDDRLGLLLHQMADALTVLSRQTESAADKVLRSASNPTTAMDEEEDEVAGGDLGEYEDTLQDCLASVYDIQLTLRKAIRFLVLSSQPPVLTASRSFVPGGGVSAATAGQAAPAPVASQKNVKREGVTPADSTDATTDQPKESTAAGDDTDNDNLSLSALRVKHRAWAQLAETLEKLRDAKRASQAAADKDERTSKDEAFAMLDGPLGSALEQLLGVQR